MLTDIDNSEGLFKIYGPNRLIAGAAPVQSMRHLSMTALDLLPQTANTPGETRKL
jgi:hypothetical protein